MFTTLSSKSKGKVVPVL